MRCALVLSAAVAATSLVFSGAAQAKFLPTPSKLAFHPGGNQPAAAPIATSISTGFETPFTTGTINGQQGWTVSTVSGVPVTSLTVSNTTPASGSQDLQSVKSSAIGAGNLLLAFSPNVPQASSEITQVSFDVRVSATGGADYIVAAQDQVNLAWEIDMSFENSFLVFDPDADPDFLTDTGATFTNGVYHNVKVTYDPIGLSTLYYLDSVLVYTQANTLGAVSIDQVVMGSDNFQNAGENGKFDNLSVSAVPEPTSLALLALGACGLVRRRRA